MRSPTVGLSGCPIPAGGVRASLPWRKARLWASPFPTAMGTRRRQQPSSPAGHPLLHPLSLAGAQGAGGAAQSWVSSRVSGLQEPSLLLQLLLRLWPSLATWASGSERIRYLQGTARLHHQDPPPHSLIAGRSCATPKPWVGPSSKPGRVGCPTAPCQELLLVVVRQLLKT